MSGNAISSELELLRQRLEELEAKTKSVSSSSALQRSASYTPSNSSTFSRMRRNQPLRHSSPIRTPDTAFTDDSMMAHLSNDESEHREQPRRLMNDRRAVMKAKQGTEFSHLSKSTRSLGARRMELADEDSEDSLAGSFGGSVDVHLDDSTDLDGSVVSTAPANQIEDRWLSVGEVNKFNQSFEDLGFQYDKFASLSMYDQPGTTTSQRSLSVGDGSKLASTGKTSDGTEKKSNLGLLGLSSRQSSRRELLAETVRQNSRRYLAPSRSRSISEDDPVEEEVEEETYRRRRRSSKRTPKRLSTKTFSMEPQVGDDDDDDVGKVTEAPPVEQHERRPPATPDSMLAQPRSVYRNEVVQQPKVKRESESHKASPLRAYKPTRRGLDVSQHQRSFRRDSAFDHCLPVNLTASGAEAAFAGTSELSSSELKSPDDNQSTSFHQFALLTLDPSTLLDLGDEVLWEDEGPRNLDGFLLAEEAHVSDKFPADKPFSVSPQAMSSFCFPNGLRVRFVPRSVLQGAKRMGWTGSKADERHVLVFTNGEGRTDHGVALTVRWELPLSKAERSAVLPALKLRRQRRGAAVRITRWLKSCTQKRMLNEALQIAGLDKIHTAEELRSELDASELRLLKRALHHHHGRRTPSTDGSLVSSSTSGSQEKKSRRVRNRLRKVLSRRSHTAESRSDAEVESVTRTAMMRSTSSPHPTAAKASASEDIAASTMESPKRNRRFLLSGANRPSMKSSRRTVGSLLSLSPRPSSKSPLTSRRVFKPRVNQAVKNKAVEAFDAIKELDKHGMVCIVEQCYTLVGCRPEDHALLIGPLQQLVDWERLEMLEVRRQIKERKQKGSSKTGTIEERKLVEKKVAERRHVAIHAMQDRLRLTVDEALVSHPKSQWDFVTEPRRFFSASIPQIPDSYDIKLPLPLPRVGKEWALAKLLREVGPDPLVLLLKLLLLERSILVVGERLEEVTAVACALLELLKPFEWASAFIPVLPLKLLDFVTSPVPFVAGVAANDKARTTAIEKDSRVLEAMSNGMSLLNLSTSTLHVSSEKGLSALLSVDSTLREQLASLQGRLNEHAEKKRSALNSYELFVQRGLSLKESLTLHSVCLLFEQYFGRLCGDIATCRDAYAKYGKISVHDDDDDDEGGEFIFNPDEFLQPVRDAVVFQEAVVKTQLFMGYVEGRRKEHIDAKEEMDHGAVGRLIAEWVYERWSIKKKQQTKEQS